MIGVKWKSVFLGAALAGGAIPAAQAISGLALTNTAFSCTDVSSTYSGGTFDRDNTGTGSEEYTVRITDGAGNVLFSYTGSYSVGTTLPARTETVPYGITPTMNPITLTLVSNAGNGLPAQQIWNASGSCAGLPSAAAVPALDAGGLAILATLLGAAGFGVRRRRQRRRT